MGEETLGLRSLGAEAVLAVSAMSVWLEEKKCRWRGGYVSIERNREREKERRERARERDRRLELNK
jgi:hypothetical protein